VAVVTTWLTGKRRRVETVIGQLTGRYYSNESGRVTAGTCGHAGSASCSTTPWPSTWVSEPGLGSFRFADLITSLTPTPGELLRALSAMSIGPQG
jgi:hypothetical protein